MGEASPIQLGQCKQDARQEVPRKTPQPLNAQQRMSSYPDLLAYLHCGELLVRCPSLAWD